MLYFASIVYLNGLNQNNRLINKYIKWNINMFVIRKVKYLAVQLMGFLQYYCAAFMRNYCQCKLHGEKRSTETNETVVVYHKAGNSRSLEISIKELLSNPTLISNFYPEDALKIGFIALEQFVFEMPLGERTIKFSQVKQIMLNSTYDVTQKSNPFNLFFESINCEINKNNEPNYLCKNIYPCRLVGGKADNIALGGTRITFTILGKRDGYDITLSELINNKALLKKFHPTEAVKFGFIHMGDTMGLC